MTPPTTNIDMPGPGPAGSPPLYHYHKSPDCLAPFKNASIGFAHGAQPYSHAQLTGWALDGFGIYAYQVGRHRIHAYQVGRHRMYAYQLGRHRF